ncbi:MAG: methyltransferase domain-containing protein [Gelidibacter sp.]
MTNNNAQLIKGFVKGKLRGTLKLFLNRSALMRKLFRNKAYAASNSDYCYGVWMKHLKHWLTQNDQVPNTVLEIGCGNSLGVGLAALISGSSKFYALERTQFWNNSTNLRVFDELVELFKLRKTSPDVYHCDNPTDEKKTNSFPSDVLNESHLKQCLSNERLQKIRKELERPDNPNNTFIISIIPWYNENQVESNSVDLICSHTVLQHVMDLDLAYISMQRWLKKGGYLSHTIDFKSMNTSSQWNGHWDYNEKEWRTVTGGVDLINREPVSKHYTLLEQYGFSIKFKKTIHMENQLPSSKLATIFSSLNTTDLTTSGLYYFANKRL